MLDLLLRDPRKGLVSSRLSSSRRHSFQKTIFNGQTRDSHQIMKSGPFVGQRSPSAYPWGTLPLSLGSSRITLRRTKNLLFRLHLFIFFLFYLKKGAGEGDVTDQASSSDHFTAGVLPQRIRGICSHRLRKRFRVTARVEEQLQMSSRRFSRC